MMLAYRTARAQLTEDSTTSRHPSPFDRVLSPMLGLAMVISIAFAGLTAARIARVERDLQPALAATRQLAAALEATRVLLRDDRLGGAESRITRADSLAQRFHVIATSTRAGSETSARLLAYDATFGEYYVAARRAAAGISMSADADGSSAESAALGYLTLREKLAAGAVAEEEAVDSARVAMAPIELAAWLSLTLLFAAALMRRLSVGGRVAAAQTRASSAVSPMAAREDDGPATLRLHDAVERLARKRLAASIAAARVAKRNNERQIELADSWSGPVLTIVPASPRVEMSVYDDEQIENEQIDDEPRFGGLTLMTV